MPDGIFCVSLDLVFRIRARNDTVARLCPVLPSTRRRGSHRGRAPCQQCFQGCLGRTQGRLGSRHPVRPPRRSDGGAGAAVIAKRCLKATGLVERTIYEQILPRLPVASLHYYGFGEEDGNFCWLFLEDVGNERFSPLVEEQRTLAARWLGTMHTSAAHIAAASKLPDGGPRRYLAHLQSARHAILHRRSNPVLRAGDVVCLEAICRQFDFLEEHWHSVEKWCEGIPQTLVHGDFRPKNMHVRTDHTGTSFFPLDWETAGWGVPAADLAPMRSVSQALQVDIVAYWATVRESWQSLDLPTIERLVNVGRLFCQIAAISWATASLGFDRLDSVWWAVESMEIYHQELSDAIRIAQWD